MFWIFFINNLILIALFYWYNQRLFIKVNLKKLNYLIFLILVIIKSIINMFNSFQINLFFTMLIYFIISMIFFKGSNIKKTLFTSFFIITSFISEMITYVYLMQVLTLFDIQSYNLFYIIIGNIVSDILLFSVVYLITKINDISDMIDSKEFWYFIIFPIISIIIMFFIISSDILDLNQVFIILLSIGIIIFNVILCKGFTDIIKLKNIQIENEKLKSQELHYLLLEEKFENSKRFIHDFKKHVNIINGYIHNHEYEKLELYLDELSLEIKNDEKFVITGNQLIDLSLNANMNLILENSIDIKYDIRVKDLDPISELDFNIIFTNILDNAIESCIRSKGQFIKIKLDKINELMILKVINPCLTINSNLETQKRNDEYHGYGLNTIKKIIKKYNGTANFEFDEKNNIFISTVILDIKNEE